MALLKIIPSTPDGVASVLRHGNPVHRGKIVAAFLSTLLTGVILFLSLSLFANANVRLGAAAVALGLVLSGLMHFLPSWFACRRLSPASKEPQSLDDLESIMGNPKVKAYRAAVEGHRPILLADVDNMKAIWARDVEAQATRLHIHVNNTGRF